MERTLVVEGLRLRAVTEGPVDGEPVLCIHGVGGWAENWRETLRALGAAGYRTTAIDLPGFGRSDPPRSARYFERDDGLYPRIVRGTIDALGVAEAHVIGHSLGGAIAFAGAVSAPERVRSLTLVAPGGLGPDLPLRLRLGSLPFVAALLRGREGAAARAALASCFHDPARMPVSLLDECEAFARVNVRETLRVLRACVTLGGVRPDLRAAWLAAAGSYRGPVLVVWGDEDRVLPPAHALLAAEHLPRARLARIGEAGHLVMVERPEAFARTILEHLAAAPPAAAPR